MKMRTVHPTEGELLRFADRELPGVDRKRVREHLIICLACRKRSLEIERAMGNFVLAREEDLSAHLPPKDRARARLRAGLSQLVLNDRETEKSTASTWFAGRLTHVAAALLFAAGALLVASRELHFSTQHGYEPRSSLTPGDAVLVSKDEVCDASSGARAEAIPASLQQAVFQEYGMATARPQDYEVDYLITPQLGGATNLRNLWPEPYSAKWNARVKDQLEERLHEMVCRGELDLRTAQHDIATDWVSAYRKYFHASQPLVVSQ